MDPKIIQEYIKYGIKKENVVEDVQVRSLY